MSMMANIHYKTLLWVLILSVSICLQGSKKMDKYDWLPTESAHTYYPMEIIKGDLIFADDSSIYIPDKKVFNNGWGNYGSIHIVGEELKPLPVKLAVTWLSYVENKFYEGSFDLPIEKLENIFKQGFIDPFTGKKVTYDRIIVGFAPQGRLSVWVAAAGIVNEIALFQAQVVNPDWNTIFGPDIDRNELIQLGLNESLDLKTRENIQKHGLALTLWNRYHERFNWRPEINGVEISSIWLTMNNGERKFYQSTQSIQEESSQQAIPKELRVEWGNFPGQRYTANITLNEFETYAAFDQLIKGSSDLPMRLSIEINPTQFTVAIYLRGAQSSLKFEKALSKIYKL